MFRRLIARFVSDNPVPIPPNRICNDTTKVTLKLVPTSGDVFQNK